MGMDRKISLGRWFRPVLGTLHSMRRVRGTAFDPFGYASIRRTERELGRHYTAVLERLAADLTEDGYDQAVEIASSPDLVRGYESVKERNIARYVERLHELGVEPPHLDHLHLADAEKENR